MSIRLKLIIIACLPLLILVLLFSAYEMYSSKINNARLIAQTINHVIKKSLQMDIILRDYVAYENQRSIMQFRTVKSQLNQSIKQINQLDSMDYHETIRKIKTNLDYISVLFEKSNRLAAKSTEQIEIKQHMVDQMLVYSGAIATNAQLLANESYRGLNEKAEDLVRTSFTAIILLSVLITVLSLSIVIGIARTLLRFLKDIRNVSSGDLDYRVNIKGNNEISHLADEFNKMLTNLKKITVHSSELEREIHRRKQVEIQLEKFAHYDVITGLPNRAYLGEMLRNTLSRFKRNEKQFALLFLDLDNFKDVNDIYGHEAGDQSLKHVAQHISQVLRATDYVARWGGDEFVVVIQDFSVSSEVADIARRVIEKVNQTPLIYDSRLSFSVSIGISLYPDAGETTADLLKNADVAMYKAKSQGKNTYQFYSDRLNRENARRLELMGLFDVGLERSEFYLTYQPVVNMETNQAKGCEVLLRWHSAELGELSPVEFIPVAESCGAIHRLGKWVVDQALSQYVAWAERYPNFDWVFNINCSTLQIQNRDFIEFLADRVKYYNVNPACITLELTETKLMDDLELITPHLEKLSHIGVKLAIDDFGTGYSSLSYLKKLPISIVKIDKSFVDDVLDDEGDKGIIEAVLKFSDLMDLEVVAEGVETQPQANCLLRLGCLYAQGYFYSKPVDSTRIEEYLNVSFSTK